MSYRRPEKYPCIIYPMNTGKDLTLEMTIEDGNPESWELFALMRVIREIQCLLSNMSTELKAYNLVSNNPDLERVLFLLDHLPQQARREYEMFQVHRTAVRAFHTPHKTFIKPGFIP